MSDVFQAATSEQKKAFVADIHNYAAAHEAGIEGFWKSVHEQTMLQVEQQKQATFQQLASGLKALGDSMQGIINKQSLELELYHRLETHIKNDTLSEEVLKEIFTGIYRLRCEGIEEEG